MSKATTLTIETRTSFSDIERLYSLLENSDTPLNLKLPLKLAYGGTFGIESALFQLIGSWARSSSSASLTSYPSPSGDNIFEKMLENPHGLIAAYMSREIIGSQGKIIDRENLLQHAKERVDSMHAGKLNDTLRGPGVFLACFAGASREFLRPFYQRPDTSGVRGTSDFSYLTGDILYSCDHKLLESMPQERLKNIAVLIRELFENTNDHAAQDENNRDFTWAYPNVRGLFARTTTLHRGKPRSFTMFKDPASVMAFSKRFLQSTKSSLSMVELTVFDFGPGIAKRYLSIQKPLRELAKVPIGEERMIVKEAFSLGSSTKKGSGVGVGLDSVVKSLGKLNAVVRLRTGRLCLRQDFSRGTKELDLVDYFPQRAQLACAAGTTFSILIPLS